MGRTLCVSTHTPQVHHTISNLSFDGIFLRMYRNIKSKTFGEFINEWFAILNEDECISYHKNLSNVLLQATWDKKLKMSNLSYPFMFEV